MTFYPLVAFLANNFSIWHSVGEAKHHLQLSIDHICFQESPEALWSSLSLDQYSSSQSTSRPYILRGSYSWLSSWSKTMTYRHQYQVAWATQESHHYLAFHWASQGRHWESGKDVQATWWIPLLNSRLVEQSCLSLAWLAQIVAILV